MELDLQSLLNFIWALCAQLYLLAETPSPPPPSPRIWAHKRGRYWSAEIDNIFVTPKKQGFLFVGSYPIKWNKNYRTGSGQLTWNEKDQRSKDLKNHV